MWLLCFSVKKKKNAITFVKKSMLNGDRLKSLNYFWHYTLLFWIFKASDIYVNLRNRLPHRQVPS